MTSGRRLEGYIAGADDDLLPAEVPEGAAGGLPQGDDRPGARRISGPGVVTSDRVKRHRPPQTCCCRDWHSAHECCKGFGK